MDRCAAENRNDSPCTPPERAPVSSCHEHWEGLLRQRQLRPPERVGTLARIDRFEILRKLGAGGMGIVFLARDPLGLATADPSSASGLVAVKIPRPELAGDARARERFLTEARHLQQFDHPHILKVLEIQTASDHPYLVMPHLRRGNLAQHLRGRGRLPPAEVLTLGLQVASALLHAHKHGIIHRDLKPANVLLDDQGRAVLTDFGLARSVFNESVVDIRREHREGTVPYMSPAVARGEAEDTRCDVYAFGALLYEMLTGQPPYAGSSVAAVTRQILQGPPLPILSLHPQAPPRLAKVAEWAMARELRHRYAHMIDVVADLQRIEAGLQPVGPHEREGIFRASRFDFQRLRRPFVLGLAAGLALLAVGTIVLLKLPNRSSPLPYHAGSGIVPLTTDFEPGSAHPQPWFLLSGQELFMLEASQTSQVQIVHRYALPWLPPPPASQSPAGVQVDLLSDFDQDGREELLLRTASSDHAVFETMACFDVEAEALQWIRHDPRGFSPPALVDLNGDGHREIFVLTQGEDDGLPEARLLQADGRTLHAVVRWTQPITWHRQPREDGRGWELRLEDEATHLLAFDPPSRMSHPATLESGILHRQTPGTAAP